MDGQSISMGEYQLVNVANLLRSGAAVVCNGCSSSGVRAIQGENGTTLLQRLKWVDSHSEYYNYDPDSGYVDIEHFSGHYDWQTIRTISPTSDTVGMDIWHCPGCGQTWRNASGAADTLLKATGVVVLGVPALGAALESGVAETSIEIVQELRYNPKAIEFALDSIQGATPGAYPLTLGGHDRRSCKQLE
jgi:hypothetical protein